MFKKKHYYQVNPTVEAFRIALANMFAACLKNF